MYGAAGRPYPTSRDCAVSPAHILGPLVPDSAVREKAIVFLYIVDRRCVVVLPEHHEGSHWYANIGHHTPQARVFVACGMSDYHEHTALEGPSLPQTFI